MTTNIRDFCVFRLGNFKPFAENQQIPIRPLTLIYGANSAGKSSIIHSLLLVNHALENGNVDVHQTRMGGQSVDLGGFNQYIHEHETERLFEWGMEVKHEPIENVVRYLGWGSRTGVQFQVGAAKFSANRVPEVVAFELSLDGLRLMRLKRQSDASLHAESLNFDHPVLKATVDRLIPEAAKHSEEPDWLELMRLAGKITDEECQRQQNAIRKRSEEGVRILSSPEELKDAVFADIARVPFSTDHFFPMPSPPPGEEDEYAYVYPGYDPQALMDSLSGSGAYWLARVLRFEMQRSEQMATPKPVVSQAV